MKKNIYKRLISIVLTTKIFLISLNLAQAQSTYNYEDYDTISKNIGPLIGMLLGTIDLPENTRKNMIKGFIHGSLTSLRANGIDISYDNLIFEKEKDQFQFINIKLLNNVHHYYCNKDLFTERGITIERHINDSGNEFYFIPHPETTDMEFWGDPCKLEISADKIFIYGIGSNKRKSNTGFKFENLKINLEAFNSSEALAIKLATGVHDQINVNLDINFFNDIGRNISQVYLDVKVQDLFSVYSKIEVSNFIVSEVWDDYVYGKENVPEFNINYFDFRLVNIGLIDGLKKLNALENNTQSISNAILSVMPPLRVDLDIVYPLNNRQIDDLILFIEKGKTIECFRRNPHPYNQKKFKDLNASLFLSIFCESLTINTNYLNKKIDESNILKLIENDRKNVEKLRIEKIKLFRQKY